MVKRKSLGRGLEALLSTDQPMQGADGEEVLKEIPIDLLTRGRYQPRVDMREESLEELAESVRAQGLIQPIMVRPVRGGGGPPTRYEIVAGERRWRAAQLAGLHAVPAVVRDISDKTAVAVALIENIQREDLNPLEQARALRRLVEEFQMTHAEAGEAVGRSRASVSNLLRLLDLPEPLLRMLERRELEMGHGRALLAVELAEEQLALARRAVKEGWSVRQVERAVQRLSKSRAKSKGRGDSSAKDPNVRRLETELAERLGAKVQIDHGASGGRIIIRYHSLDELEGIVDHVD